MENKCRIRQELIDQNLAVPIRRNGGRQRFIRGQAWREYHWIHEDTDQEQFQILYRGRYWDAQSIDFEFTGGE